MFTREYGGFQSSDSSDQPWQEVYLIGVIDVLQDYNVKKKMAHSWKAMQVEEEKLSTVEPAMYASRFLTFIASKVVERKAEPKEIAPAPTAKDTSDQKGGKKHKKKKKKKEEKEQTKEEGGDTA